MSEKTFRNRQSGYHPLRKFWTALVGIKLAVFLDLSVQYKLWLSLAFLTIAALFETIFHFLFVLAVTGVMLTVEILNTTVEALCDYIQPGYDERIKKIKDMAAGATMVALVVWYVVLGVVLYEMVVARELFSTERGERVSIPPLTFAIDVPALKLVQVVQRTPTNLRIRMRLATGADPNAVWQGVQKELTGLLAEHNLSHVTVERAEEAAEQTAGGKYRTVIPAEELKQQEEREAS